LRLYSIYIYIVSLYILSLYRLKYENPVYIGVPETRFIGACKIFFAIFCGDYIIGCMKVTSGYRSLLLPEILEAHEFFEGGDLYEFGVYSGSSMGEIIKCLKNKQLDFNCFHGFDSFEGMPKCDVEPTWDQSWEQGEFNSTSLYEKDNVSDTVHLLNKNLKQLLYKSTQSINLVPGFYEESLSKINTTDFKPAAILDIDCDLYSSSITALEFMFKNDLIKPGTIIIYDDWGGSPGYKTFSDGESRAHKEICEKYNIKTSLITAFGQGFPHVHTFFKVVEH